MISSMINAKVSKRNIQDFSAKIDFTSEEEMKIGNPTIQDIHP